MITDGVGLYPGVQALGEKAHAAYRSIRRDLEPLFNVLEAGETPGDPLQDIGRAAFKVRVKNSDNQKGKSGGYRVIYYIKTAEKTVLITIYSKSLQSDIPAEDLRRIVAKYEESATES